MQLACFFCLLIWDLCEEQQLIVWWVVVVFKLLVKLLILPMIAYNFTVWHTWLSGFCRESCASLRPSSDSSNCRQHQAPCLHCCCTLASCWTRASSTSMSHWSCAALCCSKAANSCWRSGWKKTRFVAGAGGMVSRCSWLCCSAVWLKDGGLAHGRRAGQFVQIFENESFLWASSRRRWNWAVLTDS